ncbi:hypothetical protein VCR12J2_980079 [Vibrio coralliirubri]|nr:hypothetical protein VCR12J2_980079 [Vibrio coralliirubri]
MKKTFYMKVFFYGIWNRVEVSMWGQMRDFLNIGALIGKGSVTFYLYVKRYGKK